MKMRAKNDWPPIRYDAAYYDIRHVAQHLGVSVRTLERWRDHGDLTITSLSRKSRVVSRQALLRFEMSRPGATIDDLLTRIHSEDRVALLQSLLVAPASAAPEVPASGARSVSANVAD